MCWNFVFNCDKNVYILLQNIILIAIEGLYNQSESVDIQFRNKILVQADVSNFMQGNVFASYS
jgi:hypothetical protein